MKKYLFLITICTMTVSCKQQLTFYEEKGTIFNTFYEIKYESKKPLYEKIDAELKLFNLSLNPFVSQSIVSKVNRNEEVILDEWFKTVFTKAKTVSEHSGGMFDVTASPLINLWGFGFENKDSVNQSVIDSIKAFVGFQKVWIEGNRLVKKDSRTTLNFSAIAKGFACDVIAALLDRENVDNYMIYIGGELVVKGKNPHNECWRIGISAPDENSPIDSKNVQQIVQLCKPCGFATSGNYRNFYIKDGKKYSHTIHPFTGYPAEQNILSATIVAPDCMTADAYATAFMVMGVKEACKMAEKIPEIEYYLIFTDEDQNVQVKYSEGMGKMLIHKEK